MFSNKKLKLLLIGLMILGGIALCVGGVFIEALLIPGGILISAGAVMARAVFVNKEKEDADTPTSVTASEDTTPNTPPTITFNLVVRELNMLYQFNMASPGEIVRPPNPSPEMSHTNRLTLV